jgi:hypothetical protein
MAKVTTNPQKIIKKPERGQFQPCGQRYVQQYKILSIFGIFYCFIFIEFLQKIKNRLNTQFDGNWQHCRPKTRVLTIAANDLQHSGKND